MNDTQKTNLEIALKKLRENKPEDKPLMKWFNAFVAYTEIEESHAKNPDDSHSDLCHYPARDKH